MQIVEVLLKISPWNKTYYLKPDALILNLFNRQDWFEINYNY